MIADDIAGCQHLARPPVGMHQPAVAMADKHALCHRVEVVQQHLLDGHMAGNPPLDLAEAADMAGKDLAKPDLAHAGRSLQRAAHRGKNQEVLGAAGQGTADRVAQVINRHEVLVKRMSVDLVSLCTETWWYEARPLWVSRSPERATRTLA